MHVVIFEDSDWHALAPFSLSRPVFSLASGAVTLLRKQIRHLKPTRLTLWVRPEFEGYCQQRLAPETGVPTQVNVPLDGEPALLVSGRIALSCTFQAPSQGAVAAGDGGILMAAMTTERGLAPGDVLAETDRWRALGKLPAMPMQGRLMESPVDLIYWNDRSIGEDFAYLEGHGNPKPAGPYHLVNELDVWLGRDVNLSPGCVLDASNGPVIVGAGAAIGANAVVQGPCSIASDATIAPLAIIRPGTSIGSRCKVGGEVSVSIFLGYSNKGHEGFLGHSYIGKWVNLGAGTTTSNLKNTYGEIVLMRGDKPAAAGRRFLGSLIGDHSKTSILTKLMGGTYIGYCCMLAGSGSVPRFVPSYTFWTDKGAEPYDLDKAVEVAQRVFTRRDRIWTETDEDIMNYVAKMAPLIGG